jgi:ribosomal protein S1
VNKTFLSQIEEKLDFPMNEYIHNAELQAQETLKNGTRINDMALLKGSLSSITPQGIYVTPNGIVALVDISGHIQLLVDKL